MAARQVWQAQTLRLSCTTNHDMNDVAGQKSPYSTLFSVERWMELSVEKSDQVGVVLTLLSVVFARPIKRLNILYFYHYFFIVNSLRVPCVG